jgi:hypothetical protein
MRHRSFVVTSTVILFFVAGVIAGLSFYSAVIVKAQMPGLPEALAYLPTDSQAVFGMNVDRFVQSPVYARFEQQHGQEYGSDLAEFIQKTGVDPRKDIRYVVAASRPSGEKKGNGVVIAEAHKAFDSVAITSFISTKTKPIELKYADAIVLMIPETDGSSVEKGIAFLSNKEIALGELTALKSVLDTRKSGGQSVLNNPVLGPMLQAINPDDMFWFAGDPTNILAKAPANTPLGGNISAITQVFGTLNLTDAVDGTVTVTAKDEASATKLADVARGLVALGQLASDQNPELAGLVQGITVKQNVEKITLKLNFPIEVLEKLGHAKPATAAAKKIA